MVTSDENFSAVTSVLKHIKSENTLKALSLSDAGIVHGFKDKFKEIESYGIDMIFCNDDEAVAFVIESRRASISAVQRKLRIGYNRAARIIESMEMAGLVSEMSSNGSREVLVPKQQ